MTENLVPQDAAGAVVLPNALFSLVRLLARHAAREALSGSPIEQKDNPDDEED